MQRVGEMSDALHRFRSYMWSAESLEKAKAELRSPRLNADRRKRLMYVIAQCERSLDAGWREVGTIAERDGDAAAELVAGHFLFGEARKRHAGHVGHDGAGIVAHDVDDVEVDAGAEE